MKIRIVCSAHHADLAFEPTAEPLVSKDETNLWEFDLSEFWCPVGEDAGEEADPMACRDLWVVVPCTHGTWADGRCAHMSCWNYFGKYNR
jgi:hypothetical protein